MPNLRLCFAGTPAFAAEHLSCLINNNLTPIAVYTQPDRPAGRGKKLQPSPVKIVAENAGLPVYQPSTLRNEEAQQEFKSLVPDLLIVVAYGLILPQAILDIPRFGCINVHASLLPRWRGAAPLERALLAGDKVTGVTIMQMDAGLDTGPMLHKESVAITAEDDRVTLTEKVSLAGQQALLHTIENLDVLRANPVIQDDSEATYADKLNKQESVIDWSLPAPEIDLVIRAGIGRVPAFTFLNDQRIRILKAQPCQETYNGLPGTIIRVKKDSFVVGCNSSTIEVQKIQLPGKNPVAVRDLLNSNTEIIQTGASFSDSELT
ncbi:MAG: methionyl-tRNA formyltransferase [Pseudomonadales bacterium]|nr:methionyl-tRNA formyltransferase [Pseudomonadales bacterium]